MNSITNLKLTASLDEGPGEYRVHTHDGRCVGLFAGGDEAQALSFALAAVPEMLATLSSLVGGDVTFVDGEIRIKCSNHFMAMDKVRNARNAIAKAEGTPQ